MNDNVYLRLNKPTPREGLARRQDNEVSARYRNHYVAAIKRSSLFADNCATIPLFRTTMTQTFSLLLFLFTVALCQAEQSKEKNTTANQMLPNAGTASANVSNQPSSSANAANAAPTAGAATAEGSPYALETYAREIGWLNSSNKENAEKARKSLEEAAAKNASVAGLLLGEAWLKGLLSDQPDLEQAAPWLEKASASNNVNAAMHLGNLLAGAYGETKLADPVKASEMYKRAADAGVPGAALQFGIRALQGIGMPADVETGKKWIMAAIETEKQPIGWHLLGDYEFTARKDPVAAYKLYLKGAEAGLPKSMFRVGACLDAGSGTEKDPSKAIEWITKAAQAGLPEANYDLALRGRNAAQPDTAAIYGRLVAAAAGGYPVAQEELGIHYLKGTIGGVPDRTSATNWLSIAASKGLPGSQYLLGTIGEQAGGAENLKKAKDLYEAAHKQGNPGGTVGFARLIAASTDGKPDRIGAWVLAKLAIQRLKAQATPEPELLTEANRLLGEMSSLLDGTELADAAARFKKLQDEEIQKTPPAAPTP